MKFKFYSTLFFAIFFLPCLLFSQFPDPQQVKETVKETDDKYLEMIMSGNNQFAFDLLKVLSQRSGNFLLSSYALATGLSMLGEGAKKETKTEIQQVLHFSLNISPLFQTINNYIHANDKQFSQQQLAIDAAVWVEQSATFLPAYKFSLKRNFNYTLPSIQFDPAFKALNLINQQTSQATYGKINQVAMYADLTRSTQLLLTSAFYFKAEWQHPFDLKFTQKQPFVSQGYSYNVEMMKQTIHLNCLVQPEFVVIQLPFKLLEPKGSQFCLTILLPNVGIDLKALLKVLTAQQWYGMMKNIKKQPIDLSLPQMRFENRLELAFVLQQLGMRNAFSEKADFTLIDGKNLRLNKVIQKSLLTIDESGSDARLPWQVKKETMEKEITPLKIEVNRPFFFVIQEMTTQLILAVGKMEQP